jgi:uncharacterized Zn finger protein
MREYLDWLDHHQNSVSQASACPCCGEDDMDRLIWLDDEQVKCQSCGTVYRPGVFPKGAPSP